MADRFRSTRVWVGRLLDGRRGAAVGVRVTVGADGLRFRRGRSRPVRWTWDQLRLVEGEYGGPSVRLERSGPLAPSVTVSAPEFLDAIRSVAPGFVPGWAGAGRMGRRIRRVLAAAAGAALLVFAAIQWVVPAVAVGLAAGVPVAMEARLGESVLAAFVPAESRWIEPPVDRALRGMLRRLTDGLGPTPYAFRIVVADWKMVNAFALPGGILVVTRGLIARAESPEEVAGVLAHEIQHVVRRHTTRTILERSMIGLIWTILTGDATTTAAYLARVMTELSYSRALETEADAGAVPLLRAAGVDPAGLARFFGRIRKLEGKSPGWLRYLSSHPMTDDRIDRLQGDPPPTGWVAELLVPRGEWDGIRALSARSSRKTR